MAKSKIPYPKKVASYQEQIDNLKKHGVIISDEDKAQEILADIGYYRIGFYIYPFEKTYPFLDNRRKHEVKENTKFEDIVALYYYDFDLRNILNKYISRIEVALRTTYINLISQKYKNDPYWFVNPAIVSQSFINNFDRSAYKAIRKNLPIQRHHSKYSDRYAPAWKTIEYMTLGNLEVLYDNLILDKDKKLISLFFGEPALGTFKSYLTTIRELRNNCAHYNIIFGMRLSSGIRNGQASITFPGNSRQTLNGTLKVMDFLLKHISTNRANDMWDELKIATQNLYKKTPYLKQLIERETGILIE